MNFKACILFLLYFFERRDFLGMMWHPPQPTSPFALIYKFLTYPKGPTCYKQNTN